MQIVIQKKIAMLGAPGVGKTSLVRRFVESLFDDKYLTTIGVKVDKKLVRVGATDVTLMIWDVAGAEERFAIPSGYVKGSAGFLLVADGTRLETVDAAARIVEQVDRELGGLPFVLVLNKNDLIDDWRVTAANTEALQTRSIATVTTSAKTGESVEAAFQALANAVAPSS